MADVFFHGIPLENVAGAKITDITVSPIQWRVTARARPVRAGADYVRNTGGERTITMTFVLLERDTERRQQDISAICAWLHTDTPAQLVLPGHPGRYLMAECTEYPEALTRQYWQEMRAVWTCYDPYWCAMQEKSCACGTAFTVGGSAPPYMTITNTLSASGDRSYSDGTDTMAFTGIPAGDLVIDLEKQTAAVGTTSVMDKYSFASSFIVPHTGQTTITGTGTVHWRERWV